MRDISKYALLTVASLLSVFPLYFMAVGATNSSNDVLASRMLPGSNLMQNWNNLVEAQDVGAAMYHSTLNAVATTVLALIVSSIAGYGFEVFHSPNKDRLMWVLLLAMMIPFAATMIPFAATMIPLFQLFQLFADFGLVNSTWAVVLPVIATPLLILLFRQSARSFPHEIIEAARLDGLTEIGIFYRMFVPAMKPTYAAAAVITFMAAWNNFLWPKVILVNNEYQTTPMLISNFTAGYVVNYEALMLAVLIASIPTILILFVLQRAFVAGFTGVVK